MTVVFIRSNPVNPDSRVEKEVNALLKKGYQIIILAWDRDSQHDIKEDYLSVETGIVKIFRFGIPAKYGGGLKFNLIPLIRFQINLYQWLKKHRNTYDIIHACDFDTAFISSQIAKKYNKRLVYDIFDYYVDAFNVPLLLRNLIESIDHRIINFADATIICTEKRKKQIKKSKPKNLCVIHNTPSQNLCKESNLKLDSSKIKIAYVGILSDGRFIKEVADYVIDNPEYEFHVGGFGNLEKYLHQLSKEYTNIFFYGRMPYNKTLQLENSCDIMVAIYDPSIPNHFYAAPNKFYEALMLGKPIIMAKNTGMDDLVYENAIGQVIEYSTDSFKNGLEELKSKRHLWNLMSIKMKELYLNSYRWEEMENKLQNLYKIILEEDVNK